AGIRRQTHDRACWGIARLLALAWHVDGLRKIGEPFPPPVNASTSLHRRSRCWFHSRMTRGAGPNGILTADQLARTPEPANWRISRPRTVAGEFLGGEFIACCTASGSIIVGAAPVASKRR